MKNTPFVWRLVDLIHVKGRSRAVKIYEPLCLKDEASQELLDELTMHLEALKSYYAKDWNKAKELFTTLHLQAPERYLYQIFLSRIEGFIQKPPAKDWDGVFTHTQK